MQESSMPTTETLTRGEAEIRAQVDALAQRLAEKDINGLMAHYAPGVVTFDLRPPHQVQSADRYRRNFEAWFASVEGPIDYEIGDLRIVTSGEVAFCHSLNHVSSTKKAGEKADYWVRVTSGFQKLDGQWLIAHEHVSVPIHMETMQAALNLE
jgi:uncharacterized protein (TIGR02246 family)